MGLEEVVIEAVDVQYRPTGATGGPATDERGQQWPLLVLTQIDPLAFVRRSEHVRFHTSDATSPYHDFA